MLIVGQNLHAFDEMGLVCAYSPPGGGEVL